jgi:hypothetical protein
VVEVSDIRRTPRGADRKGKLLLFREVDRSFDLPPGTAKRLLKEVADRFWLVSVFETESSIRFEKTSHAPRKGDRYAR